MTVQKSNASSKIVTTNTNVKLSVNIEPSKYINRAPTRNAKKKKAAIGWLNRKRQWIAYHGLHREREYLDC